MEETPVEDADGFGSEEEEEEEEEDNVYEEDEAPVLDVRPTSGAMREADRLKAPSRPKGAGWLSKVSPQQSESKQTDAADDRSPDTASMLRLRRRSTATEEQYPMWVVPLHHFLALKHLKPHAQMRAERKLVQWTGEMKEEGTVIYISHQWTAFDHPDHSGKQLRSLQRMLERMVMGRVPDIDAPFTDKQFLQGQVKIYSREWGGLLKNCFIWIDYASVPQKGLTLASKIDHAQAIESIPAYIERSKLFFVLCPKINHRDLADTVCDEASCLDHGWCRAEMTALLLSNRQRLIPPILIKGAESPPTMISVLAAMYRTPGTCRFGCCACNHKRADAKGNLVDIVCDRAAIGRIMCRLLANLSKSYQSKGRLDDFRLWKAVSPHFVQELPCEDMPSQPANYHEFLEQYHFKTAGTDGSVLNGGGISTLLLACISGNLTVAQELVRRCPEDVNSRVKTEVRALGIAKGFTPLHAAMSFCPPDASPQIVKLLIESGADPNAAFDRAQISPLYTVTVTSNLAGLSALVSSAGSKLNFKKGNIINDTALGGAAYFSNVAMIDALIELEMDCGHISDIGSTKLHSACENSRATPAMLESLLADGKIDICHKRKPKTLKWGVICRFFEFTARCRFGTSDFSMDLATCRGSTALHHAAKVGNTPLVVWLLDHGASPSLHVKNALGLTPLEMSRVFGPHPETAAVLVQAVLREDFERQYNVIGDQLERLLHGVPESVTKLARSFSRGATQGIR